ncbi:MAG: hypothetical protein RI100_06000 [Nitrosarchaeum sp.]|jgi:hypothetical protein|uniref:hypothetical protein n=1 Tax=Nitrosarchaeum sp. TaxID=2026886 RepID=UPI002DEA66A8|nr:hypothetical protein [Nitrosarchaeum sp.]
MTGSINKKQDGKLFVRIDLNVVDALMKLARPNEISPELITKAILHCHTCDTWRIEQKKHV